MIPQYFTRRNMLAVVAGFLSVFALAILRSQIYVFVIFPHANMSSYAMGHEYSSIDSPYNLLYVFLVVFAQFENTIGGFITGLIVKDKGWLCAAAVGFLLPIVSILVNFVELFLPGLSVPNVSDSARFSMAFNSIAYNLAGIPMTVLMTGIGGLLVDVIRYRRRMKSETTVATGN